MKKCNSCGEINKDNAKFCIKCGKSIIESGSKQEAAKIETSKYIKKPVVETGRNRNFKIFMGLIGGFAAVAVIAVILIFVLDIGNLTNPFKSITEEGKGEQITELPKEGLTAGESTQVASAEISSDGGILSIDEGALSGFSIEVLENTFTESVKFDVSTAQVESHEFGDDFNPASPLITIDNGDIFGDTPMMVTIPIQIEDDEFAMAFFYDEQTRSLQGLPLLSLTNNELVTLTQHFSKIVVSKTKKDNIKTVYDTKFKPKVDDFQIPNNGSYIGPGGYCMGTCVAEAYYYLKKELNQGNTLYGRFDNDGHDKTPNYWEDDADAVRLVSSIQKVGGDLWDNPTKLLAAFKKQFDENIDNTQTYYAILYAMMFSKQPQIIDLRDGKSGHVVLAYKITEDAIYIADPNYPGDATKRIPISKDSSGKIKFGKYESYNKMSYFGLYALMNEGKTYGLWREVIDGSPTQGISAADFFPDDIVIEVVVGKDKNGKDIIMPLTDGLILTEEAVEKLGMGNNLVARVANGKTGDEVWMIMDTGNRDMGLGTSFNFVIEKGVNHIRILHMKNGKYVNFYWYDLIYGAKLTANPEVAKTGEEVSFSIDLNGSPYTFKWDFGDGDVSIIDGTASAKHVYTKEGTYAVSVGIYNKAGEYLGKTETTMTVKLEKLELTLSANPWYPAIGEAVSFSTNITNKDYRYKWDLGDGTILDEVGLYKTEHIYSLEGAYGISVEIYDGNSKLVGKTEDTVVVQLELEISVNPNRFPAIGKVVSFSTNITNKDYRYKWDLGDGTILDEVALYKTEHTYSLGGAYRISVEIYDGNGKLVGKTEDKVAVQLVELELSVNPDPVTLGEAVSLSTNITNKDYRYVWKFGDGTILNEVGLYKTEHIYSLEDYYYVEVWIYGRSLFLGIVYGSVEVAPPSSNSEIVGEWIYQSETAIYSNKFAVAYTITTFVLNSDGTCSYEYLPVILREPTNSIEDAERINLLNTYPIRYPGMAVPEYEGGQGTYTYLGKGQYIQEDAVGYAKLTLKTASSEYDYENFIFLMDTGQLVFYSTEFTKK
jgi:PKD repeat protein